MKLIGNKVLVEPLPQKKVSAGGIVFAEQHRDDEKQWRVVAVGTGRIVRKKGKPDVLIPIDVQPGDYVLAEVGYGTLMDLPDGRMIIEPEMILAKWQLPTAG